MTPWRASRGGTTFTPDSYVGLRRYQIIGVNRSGHIALWMHDMGPAEDFRFGSLQVVALWEETVEWVQAKALEIREKDLAFAESVIKERQAILKETWPIMAQRQVDLRKKYQTNQSTFGPHMRAERN